MSFKRRLVWGALVLVAASAVAAVSVMHHPGLGHSLHHGGTQASPGDGAAAVHAAKAGVAALGKQWNASVRDATTELYGELLRQQSSAGIREIAFSPTPKGYLAPRMCAWCFSGCAPTSSLTAATRTTSC
jgi:hypothetical protein